MLTRRTLLAAATAGAFWPGIASGQGPRKRFGLVIGNEAYPRHVGRLNNAADDARLVANVLKQCGFLIPDDALVINGNKRTMEARIRAHSDRVAAAGPDALGFIYYSGHGAARRGGDNYLIPIVADDLDLGTASVWDESVAIEWLLSDALSSIQAPQVIALDACRNELRTNERGIGGDGSLTVRGLEVVRSGEDANLFLSFSTWQGQTASDGAADARHGPYALALANCLTTPGPILTVFDKVRREVKRLTGLHQEVMNVSRLNDAASDIEIGGGVSASSIPPLAAGGRPAVARSIGDPASLALCISCSYAGSRLPLPSAHRDAEKVAAALRASSFAVDSLRDPDGHAMNAAIVRFREQLDRHGGEAVGVVHFSGHSAGIAGRGNILVPEGPIPTNSNDLVESGYLLRGVVEELSRARAAAIVIFLDSCFSLDIERSVGKTLATEVAQVVNEQGMGPVLVGFSASPGQFAVLEPGGSPFADVLAAEIIRPERRDLAAVMRAVSATVFERTRGAMRPSYLQSAPIYFRDGRGLVRARS